MRSFLVVRSGFCLCAIFAGFVGTFSSTFAEMVPARHKQGSVHGFLILKSETGKVLAVGDQVCVSKGNQVQSRLTFRFRDGSIDDETTTFRQGRVFQLVRDHHIQKGPSFPEPMDMTVNVPTGEVTWKETKEGKSEMKVDHMDLPPDLSNGLVSQVVENFPSSMTEIKVLYLVGGSKPRLVKLVIKPDGQDSFRIGGNRRGCNRFNIHIEIGGLAGAVAPILGKQPEDIKLWMTDGNVPAFLKMKGPLFQKGPTWTMMLTSPTWLDSPAN